MSDAAEQAALDDHYRVPEASIAAFRETGHVYLPAVCSADEVAAARRDILKATEGPRAAASDLSARDTYGKAFLQMMNLWASDPDVARFVQAKRMARVAAELMGVDGVRIYHDQALFKEAGGGYTPWHQDQHYWPLDTDNTITMWMPLVDLTEDMGIMKFASRSHTEGYFAEFGGISDETEAGIDALVAERGFALSGQPTMRAGDATFHYGWTLHRAPGNSTAVTREVMTVIYIADGARVTEPDSDERRNDLESWMPGCKPGDLAASPLNPLVYKA